MGKGHLQLTGSIVNNPHGSIIFSGGGIEGEQGAARLWSQGAGVTIRLHGVARDAQLKFSEFQDGRLEVWSFDPQAISWDYAAALGKPSGLRRLSHIAPLIEQLLSEVYGDPRATLGVMLAVEKFKSKEVSEEKKKISKRLVRLASNAAAEEAAEVGARPEEIEAHIEEEFSSGVGKKHIVDLDAAVAESFSRHYSEGFHLLDEPLIDVDFWTAKYELDFPCHHASSSVVVPPSAHRAGQEHRVENKRVLRWLNFIEQVRLRNPKNLVSFALLVSLSSIAKGDSDKSQLLVVKQRLALSTKSAKAKLVELQPEASASQLLFLKKQVSITWPCS